MARIHKYIKLIMVDNKPLEEQAEAFVKSNLIKYGFHISKPSFDFSGIDLLIIDQPDEKKSKILKVQCKGRSLCEKGNNVTIPISYVDEGFILFVYIVKKDNKADFLYMFSQKDIQKWNKNSQNYTFTFTDKFLYSEDLRVKLFDGNRAEVLRTLLTKVEIKTYTTIIIDGIFLEQAMFKTMALYKKIWPNKNTEKPNIKNIIQHVLECFDVYKAEDKNINCYLFKSNDTALDYLIEVSPVNCTFEIGGHCVCFYREVLDGFIALKAVEKIQRLVNSENIILLASDILYEAPLLELQHKDVNIVCVTLDSSNGGNMYTSFQWGNVMYPLGLSLGFERYEL